MQARALARLSADNIIPASYRKTDVFQTPPVRREKCFQAHLGRATRLARKPAARLYRTAVVLRCNYVKKRDNLAGRGR